MAQKQVQITVEASIYDILQAVAKAVKDAKLAAKSGQSGAPLVAAIGSALVMDLAPVISEAANIGGDVAESKVAALESVLACVSDLVSAISA